MGVWCNKVYLKGFENMKFFFLWKCFYLIYSVCREVIKLFEEWFVYLNINFIDRLIRFCNGVIIGLVWWLSLFIRIF